MHYLYTSHIIISITTFISTFIGSVTLTDLTEHIRREMIMIPDTNDNLPEPYWVSLNGSCSCTSCTQQSG